MRSLQHKVLASVDKLPFALRIRTPEHKHQMFAPFIQRIDSGIRQFFPSFALMTTGVMCLHRERRIQQQHPLFRLTMQVSAGMHRSTQIALNLLVYIYQ